MKARRAALLAVPVVAAAGIGTAVAVEQHDGGNQAEGATGARSGGPTVAVARRTLVDRQRVDGTLGYSGTRPAANRLSGTITWLPHTGQVIHPGQTLFRVDGQPVVLMNGGLPAYRDLRSGVADGRDVLQLERGLRALGYDPGTVDETFTSTTADAVRDWQQDRGLTETGAIALGRVVFLPGARRVSAVKASLGSTASAPAAEDPAGRAELAAYRAATATAPTVDGLPTRPAAAGEPTAAERRRAKAKALAKAKARARAKAKAKALADARGKAAKRNGDGTGQDAKTQTGPGSAPTASGGKTPSTASPVAAGGGDGSGDGGSGGDGGGSGGQATEVLTTTSTRRAVTAAVDAADQGLVAAGRRVRIELPDGRTVSGRIASVGTVATAADSGSGDPGAGDGSGSNSPTITVTIRLTSAHAAGRLDQAPVSVQLARTTRRNVLAVPVQALIARPGGGYAVERADGRLVDVVPGLFADGYVELTDGAVTAGDRVRVPA